MVYDQGKDSPCSLPADTQSTLEAACAHTYTGSLAALGTQGKEVSLLKLLSLFITKRPDIGYFPGMANLMAISLHVFPSENAAFGVFCHLIERIFPIDYFSHSDRQVNRYAEYRLFALLAERLRPRLVQSLTAIFHPKVVSLPRVQTREFDYSPFILTMTRLSESWFSSLFTSSLYPSDLLRVWDCMFIHGFEFVQKIALALLSRYERFVRNTVKQETKALNMGNSVDVLITAGNLARLKLVKKYEKQQIEKMIKKALMKQSYTAVSRNQFYSQAVEMESNLKERLSRLRISKSLFREIALSFEDLRNLFTELHRLSLNHLISRRLFLTTITKNHGISEKTALNVFITFDQAGNEGVKIQEILLGLAIIGKLTLEEKLMMCFNVFDEENRGVLETKRVMEMVEMMEKTVDRRGNSFERLKNGLFVDMERNEEGNVTLEAFVRSFKETPATKGVLELIWTVEREEDFEGLEMRLVDFTRSGDFSEIHSPLTSSDIATPVSEEQDEAIPDPEDLEARLESLLANDLHEPENLKPEDNFFEGIEDNMQKLLEEDEDFIDLPKVDKEESVEPGVQMERKPTMKKMTVEYWEEGKREGETWKGYSPSEESLPIVKKDTTRKNGCSRLCNREMCSLS